MVAAMNRLAGGCHCGMLRYEITGPLVDETCCHCGICRGVTGAPCVAWATVARSQLVLVTGEPATYRSSPHATRSFCPRCGTQILFADDNLPDQVDVTLGSLDEPGAVPPRDHTWVSAKLPWVALGDELPAFDGNAER